MQDADREIILDAQAIQERIGQLGQAISRDYAAGNLLVIVVRAIDLPLVTDFIQVSSYGTGASSLGDIILRSCPTIAVRDYDVLLVEDIVDSGLTVQWLVNHFTDQGACSVKVCALIDKAERREHPVQIDYCGFSIHEGFLVGYGLDLNEHYRGLPAIYHLHNAA